MGRWNEPDLWKFSWHPFVNEFFCYGDNGWGSQFGYHFDDIRSDVPDAPMYMLAYVHQRPRPSDFSFGQYLEQGFLTNARHRLTKFSRRVRRKFGDLAPGELAVLAPDPLIGGPERVGNVVKMPAVTAMVILGDTATELARVSEGFTIDGEVSQVVPYVDEKGRGRIRLEYQAF